MALFKDTAMPPPFCRHKFEKQEHYMNKKERFQAVRERRAPDYMPVWPRVMSQMLFSHGCLRPDVTGVDWYNADKVTEAVLASIKHIDYDVALPTYIDHAFGVPPLGGEITIPDKFGIAAGPTDNKPVMSREDWPHVKQLVNSFDHNATDPRMTGALKVIKHVSHKIGNDTPLVTNAYVGSVAAMHLFRPNAAILDDMYEDPDWVDEMCYVATDWTMDWIRAEVKDQISKVGDGKGIMMAPSCQLLPATPNAHFKAWVEATHEYGTYPLQ